MTTSEKTSKQCFKCNQIKSLDEFYRHKMMADGRLNKCKDCTKRDAYEHRHFSESRPRILAYDRKRGSRQSSADVNEYRKNNPKKYKAHIAVGNALREGKLHRPDRCSHCKVECKPEGHHEDYQKPLDVVWLCSECHRNLHAFYETIGRKISA